MKPSVFFSAHIIAALIATVSLKAQDTVPKLINYQGKLTDASGQAMANGTYKLRFGIYSKKDAAQAGDSLVWGMDYDVTLVGGQFNAVLGAGGGTPVAGAAVNDIGFAFTGGERYVQLTVLTDHTGANLTTPQVLLPRQQLLSVPYALNGTPAGAILPYAGTVPPAGYLMCDGQIYNKADYPALAAVLNTATGAAFGGTAGTNGTFNVPDLRGRFLRGTDDPDGSGTQFTSAGRDPDNQASSNNGADGRRYANATGGNVGNSVGSIQLSAVVSHDHGPGNYSTNTTGSHTHAGPTGENSYLFTAGTSATVRRDGNAFSGGPMQADGAHAHTVQFGRSGSTGGSETRPANAYVNFIIKF